MTLAWFIPYCAVESFLIMQEWLCHPQSGHIQLVWRLLPPCDHPDDRGRALPARSLSRLQCSGEKLGDQDEDHPRGCGPLVSAALQASQSPLALALNLGSWKPLSRSWFKRKLIDFGYIRSCQSQTLLPPASNPRTHAITIQGGKSMELLALHAASHHEEILGPDLVVLGLTMLGKYLGHNSEVPL